MRALIIDNHSRHTEKLASIFTDNEIIERENLLPTIDTSDFDLIIISGGSNVPTVLRHRDEYENEIELIKNSNIPIIGICLGLEIICTTFGGSLTELNEDHRGVVSLTIDDKSLSSTLMSDSIDVYEGHKIVIKEIPNDFISCAHSSHGIEIIKHINKPIIGFQFHPEASDDLRIFNWAIQTLNLEY